MTEETVGQRGSRREFIRTAATAGSVVGMGSMLAGCLSFLENSGERPNDDGTKTYANRKFDFEITYPEAWILDTDEENVEQGELRIIIPASPFALFLVIATSEFRSPKTWEEEAAFQLRDLQTDIDGYTVIAQRDVTLGGGLPAQIVDARWPRSTDGIIVRQKMMTLVSREGTVGNWMSIIGREELYESENLDGTAETVFASFVAPS